MDPLEILKKYWGYDSFRPMQREIIDSVLAHQDTLGLLPTGAGKSITFQVPGLALGGITLVITPLIALMKDQVDNLNNKGIRAAFLHSGMSRGEVSRVWQSLVADKCRFLYIAPERLLSQRFMDEIRELKRITLVVVDEAHCISQWGYDFRPAYLGIASLRKVIDKRVPFLALTASATPTVASDIQQVLGFKKECTFRTSFARSNISYVVRSEVDRIPHIIHILRQVPGSSIVYVRSRKLTVEVADSLRSLGVAAAPFHAGMDYEMKAQKIAQWKQGIIRVMVATNAFGMGIDKPNVRTVIHYGLPPSLEEYYQEAGRAGRDGLPSYAVVLTSAKEQGLMRRRVSMAFPPKDKISLIYERICNFLGIALEEGYDHVYAFDLDKFCDTFKMQRAQVENALNLLGSAGYMAYIEERDNASRIKIEISREELYAVCDTNGNTDKVLYGLLRLYPGIFTNTVYINETAVGKYIGLRNEDVYQTLIELRRRGVISFIPRSATPLIYMPTSREETRYVQIPKSVYEQRRAILNARTEAVISYAKESKSCRASKILEYFGEKNPLPCQSCDNCRHKRIQQRIRKESSSSFRDRVINTLATQSFGLSSEECMTLFKPRGEEAITLLDALADEGMISVRVFNKNTRYFFNS